MARCHNFNAGPAAMPEAVLEKAKSELLEMAEAGMSVMEMSHRSKQFEDIIAQAESGIRRLLGVPETMPFYSCRVGPAFSSPWSR